MAKPKGGNRGGGVRAPRPVSVSVNKPKDVCISTNCGEPRKPPKLPPNKDPRFIRPKKKPVSRNI